MALLVRNATVIPMEPAGSVVRDGWVLVEPPLIAALGTGPPPPSTPGDRVIDAHGGLVVPGFVSAHQHLLDVLLRGGLPHGLAFLDWLLGLYYAGMAAYTPEDAGLATTLAIAETVAAGVTCIVDNWGVDNGSDPERVRACAEASLAAWRASGLRVVFARMFATQWPTSWGQAAGADNLVCEPDRALAAIEDLVAAHDGSEDGRIRVCPSPELPELVHPAALRDALAMARRHGTVMPMHLLASPQSRAAASAEWLDAEEMLDPALLGAHCTAARPEDISRLATAGVKVAHCPTSNGLLGGLAPVAAFLRAGITVGLGSDNATLNCNSDIVAEMRRAVIGARIAGAGELTAAQALEMATIGGARAAGLGDLIGSLTPGKRADLVVLDTSGPHWWPHHDWVTTLVMQGRASDVRTVIVDGRIVLDDGEIVVLDPDQRVRLYRDAQVASERIACQAGLGPGMGPG